MIFLETDRRELWDLTPKSLRAIIENCLAFEASQDRQLIVGGIYPRYDGFLRPTYGAVVSPIDLMPCIIQRVLLLPFDGGLNSFFRFLP
jgi:hypothetical protein